MARVQIIENQAGQSFSREATGGGTWTREYLVTTEPPAVATPPWSLLPDFFPIVGGPGPDGPECLVVDRQAFRTDNPLVWRVAVAFRRQGDPLPAEDFARMMQAIAERADSGGGQSHIDADALLCVQLRLMGYGDAVDRYEELDRWFE